MNAKTEVFYTASVIRNGEEVQTVKGKNLLLDAFFSSALVAGRGYGGDAGFQCFLSGFHAGTGTTANFRDSGSVTFNTDNGSPLTVTASAGFFVSTDVGNTLKLDSGEELKITGFTSSTVVTCQSYPGTIVDGAQGTVWFTARTDLDTPVFGGSNYNGNQNGNYAGGFTQFLDTGAGTFRCETGWTVDSSISAGVYSISELGWCNSGSGYPFSNMFGRAVLTTPLSIIVGDILRLSLKLVFHWDCTAHTVGSGAFAGTSRFYGPNNSSTVGKYVCPAGGDSAIGYHTASIDLSAIHSANLIPAGTRTGSWTNNGDGKYTYAITLGTGDWNTTYTGVSLGNGQFVHKFDSPVSKTNLQTGAFSFSVQYRRDMPN